MNAWRLTMRDEGGGLIDASALLPERLASLASASAVAQVSVTAGTLSVQVADLFDVERITAPALGNDRSGEAAEPLLVIDNACARLTRVGAAMSRGTLSVDGDVGDLAASGMTGGVLIVAGSAGDYLGAELRAGHVEVRASAGDFVAAALPGSSSGMRGGTLVVGANVGDRLGDRMRRGTVVVGGDAGAYAASRTIAGTLAIMGGSGTGTAYGMKRGTLMLGRAPGDATAPAAGFVPSAQASVSFQRLLAAEINRLLNTTTVGSTQWTRFVGDRRVGGQAEILLINQH